MGMGSGIGVARTAREAVTLDADPRSVAAARDWLLERARPFVDGDRIEQLRLVAGEVVSNAVRHGAAEGEILLAVTPKDGYLCVQCTDGGAGFAPRPRAHAPDENGGWGFFLIEHLTRRWGLTRENQRTRVWFEFDFGASPRS